MKTKFSFSLVALVLIVFNVGISNSSAFELPGPDNCKGSRIPEGTNTFRLDPSSQSRVNRLLKSKGCVPAGTKLTVIGKVRNRAKLGFDSLVLSVNPSNFREDGQTQFSNVPLVNLDNGGYSVEITTPKHTGPTGLNEPQGISSAIYDEELGFNQTPEGFISYCNMRNASRIRFKACVGR